LFRFKPLSRAVALGDDHPLALGDATPLDMRGFMKSTVGVPARGDNLTT
jgi:hypothetical protein